MNRLTDIAWLALCAVWAVGAVTTKRTARTIPLGQVVQHTAILLFAVAVLLAPPFRRGPLGWRVLPDGAWVEAAGDALQIAGIAFCIWARLHLGRNWSGMVDVKQDHALIRSGPYAFVRHPIYTGLLLAILGKAVEHNQAGGLVAFAILTVEWKRKSLIEERLMVDQFGARYHRYRAEVKGLIPGVW